jgi:putative flippase GtrA
MTTNAKKPNRSWAGWWRFLIIGLGGYLALTFGTIALVEWINLGERPAYTIMITLVMIGNFYATRHVVFPSSRSDQTHQQAIRFFTAALSFRVLEFFLFSLLIGPLAINYVVAIAITAAASYVIKYYVFSIWVFR